MRTGSAAGGEELIEQAVSALRVRLPRGSRREDLLREVRDGLVDARDAYCDAGLDGPVAAARAVADFGDVDVVAALVAERQVARSTRVAVALLGPGYAAVLAAWLVLGPLIGVSARSHESGGAAETFVWLGLVSVVIAASAGLGLRRAARQGRSTRGWARVVGVTGLACGFATLVASWLVAPWELGPPAGPWRSLDSVETFSGALIALMVVSSGWCLATSRHRAP